MKFVFAKDKRDIKNINVAFQNKKPIPKGLYELHLAARNVYRVWMNNQFIHYGPSRSAHQYLQKDVLSIALPKDSNYITIEVVGHNVNNYYFADELPLFGIDVYQKSKLSLTTDDFACYLLDDRTRKIQRYSFQRNFAESYIQQKDRSHFYLGNSSLYPTLTVETVDAPILIKRQTPYPKFEVKTNIVRVETGTFHIDYALPVWNNRAIDNISTTFKGYPKEALSHLLSDDVSRYVYQKNNKDGSYIKTNEYQIFDTQRTLTGFIRLKVKVMETTTFDVIFDEVDFKESDHKNTDGIYIDFSRNDCSNIIHYRLEPGTYDLQSFEPYSVRYMNVAVSKGHMDILSCHVVTFENHEVYQLNVKTSDEDLNLIVQAAQHTLAQNAVDILSDCPSRERAGWLCDAWFSAKAEQLMSGHNDIEKNFLMSYAKSPESPYLPKGMIPMNYPADHTDGIYIPNWSLWYGVELYDYYLRTSDESLIEQSLHKIEGIIQYFKNYENELGLLEDLESWVFVEWSAANDFVKGVNIPSNMLYAHFLECVGALYQKQELLEQAQSLKKAIRSMSFNGTFFVDQLLRDADKCLKQTKNMTETCQYYAFFTNTATKKTDENLYHLLFQSFGFERDTQTVYPEVHQSNAFIGNYLRLEILRRQHAYKQLLKECKSYFLYMAKRTQTLWEHQFVHGSLNHGFASYAANLIIEALTGISGYNEKRKEIYMTQTEVHIDFKMKLPYGKGLTIIKKGNDVTIDQSSDVIIINN